MQREVQRNTIGQSELNTVYWEAQNHSSYYLIKRSVDIVLAFLLIILFSPFMLFIAMAIVIYSPGPVFFVQERIGSKRRSHDRHVYWMKVVFPCYKFRTMHVNSDSSIHQEYFKALIEKDVARMNALQGSDSSIRKLVQDARVTRPGRLLRKLSLDELPQLWNVLRGDMSLVGPRPAIPYEVEMYQAWQLRRLQAQPGITGLQQITARSTADFDEQVQLDLRYIDHQSLWLDFIIMIRTPLVILSTRGAA
jgi:lipopolysaccharide/colanic/teichoic acid biosynthesis glycosyltransferase